ncbi:Lrp/AsnC family transcriptional regulator [Poritiphilus flavus]|uniref:Winged helix-turn-helix transcriptional regulator n=1 Tax=Poritiphilus flavus TaxID=2697053 RepID=A0A6L9E7G6_9FLAO|nr:Lrp/AsnC family transcriptional regulator [Poritiphilus flavus]NAS10725.1 winged helix-turn-helix transcriptional regulator [Poritiphilus flavus]
MNIDHTNWLILEELQRNARASLREISHKVGLSSPSVAERIQKMEDAGIVKGYAAALNMEELGYPLGVYISIKIRFGKVAQFEEFIPTVPEICECHKLTGHDCMLMKGYVKNPRHLEDLNGRLTVYGELTTSLILSSIIDSKVYQGAF